MHRRSALLAAAAVMFAAVAFAQAPNPFVGTWKFDPAASTGTGPKPTSATITISDAGNGQVRVEVNEQYEGQPAAAWSFVAAEGQETDVSGLPAMDKATSTRKSERVSTGTFKKAGKVVSEYSSEVSADGKRLTITSKGLGPDGKPTSSKAIYHRS